MIRIHTPERAERLARSFEAQQGVEVRRLLEDQPIISTRGSGEITIAVRIYARVYRKGFHVANITYETIDGTSVLL